MKLLKIFIKNQGFIILIPFFQIFNQKEDLSQYQDMEKCFTKKKVKENLL